MWKWEILWVKLRSAVCQLGEIYRSSTSLFWMSVCLSSLLFFWCLTFVFWAGVVVVDRIQLQADGGKKETDWLPGSTNLGYGCDMRLAKPSKTFSLQVTSTPQVGDFWAPQVGCTTVGTTYTGSCQPLALSTGRDWWWWLRRGGSKARARLSLFLSSFFHQRGVWEFENWPLLFLRGHASRLFLSCIFENFDMSLIHLLVKTFDWLKWTDDGCLSTLRRETPTDLGPRFGRFNQSGHKWKKQIWLFLPSGGLQLFLSINSENCSNNFRQAKRLRTSRWPLLTYY